MPINTDAEVNLPEFRAKLAQCAVISSSGDFDIGSFAARVGTVHAYQSLEEPGYLVIGLGDDDPAVYAIFVNGRSNRAENPLIATLQYNGERLALHRMEVIG